MREFKIKIYDVEEAFLKTLEGDTLTDAEAARAFKQYRKTLRNDETSVADYMVEFMEKHNDDFKPIPDALRSMAELDCGAYYIAVEY